MEPSFFRSSKTQRQEKREKVEEPLLSTSALMVLGGIAFLLTFLMALTLYRNYRLEDGTSYTQPDVVIQFFDEMFNPEIGLHKAIKDCVLPAMMVDQEVWISNHEVNFEYLVFALENPVGYEITKSEEGYVELVMFGEDGNPIYPRLGFRYRLSEYGTHIADYTVGRLNPPLRLDEEYDKRWAP